MAYKDPRQLPKRGYGWSLANEHGSVGRARAGAKAVRNRGFHTAIIPVRGARKDKYHIYASEPTSREAGKVRQGRVAVLLDYTKKKRKAKK